MIPKITDPKWKEVLSSSTDYNLSALATKILLMRVRLMVKNNPAQLNEAIAAAHDFFTKNIDTVKDDIKKIFG